MYRKRNGSMGFSFTRFAHAAVPNFFNDDSMARSGEITALRKDMCYAHQTASANPLALDERSFYVAGVVDTESLSKKVHKALKKHEILREDNTPDTYKIGNRFTHQLAIINLVRQRELVGMLFWWEEECQRLRKLDAELAELDGMIKENEKMVREEGGEETGRREMLDQMKFARERVRMKKRQVPTQRRPDVENDTDDLVMAFHGRSKSAPAIPAGQVGQSVDSDLPPEYYAGPR